jgi:hypothetical protein
MSKKDIVTIRNKFSFLENKYYFICTSEENTKFLDVVIIEYCSKKQEKIKIEKERGYYTFKIFSDNDYIDYPSVLESISQQKYNYLDYFGDAGLDRLSNEIDKYLSEILSAYQIN